MGCENGLDVVCFYNNWTNKIVCGFAVNNMILLRINLFQNIPKGKIKGKATCKGSEYSLAIQSRRTTVPKEHLVISPCLHCTSYWQPFHLAFLPFFIEEMLQALHQAFHLAPDGEGLPI